MAYRCIISLKEECDGCGRCEDERPVCLLNGRRGPFDWADDDPLDGDPFDVDLPPWMASSGKEKGTKN